MTIDKRKLLEKTRERWPLCFRVTPTDGVPSFEAEPKLGDVYQTIEASCAPADEWTESDEWTNLANWSFHQALWKLAEQAATERHIHREDVTLDMFDDWMRFNLSEEGWAAERREYEGSPSSFH